jgi:hypothetical protein
VNLENILKIKNLLLALNPKQCVRKKIKKWIWFLTSSSWEFQQNLVKEEVIIFNGLIYKKYRFPSFTRLKVKGFFVLLFVKGLAFNDRQNKQLLPAVVQVNSISSMYSNIETIQGVKFGWD